MCLCAERSDRDRCFDESVISQSSGLHKSGRLC